MLIPLTEHARRALETAVAGGATAGQETTVTGLLSDEPNVFMRGQLLKVLYVGKKPGG
ncbi:MAG TPA: hypothetical protein GX513_04395 [Firmicutes bacterium]|nr:hypothetical protein [Bacillota bacterium]